MPEITGIDSEMIESTMSKADIPGVSIAYRESEASSLSTTNIGTTDTRDTSTVNELQNDSVFGAASLSKPVFAYLVLKLIDKGVLSRAGESAASGLDRPLYDILPLSDFFSKHSLTLSETDIEAARTITPRMLLSHTSGINDHNSRLNFTPGQEYSYTGMGLFYLQAVIEKSTGKLLEDLAQEYVFSHPELKMKHSSFVPPGALKEAACAAKSLFTTASDYSALMNAWMKDKSPIMQEAFEPQISLIKDNQIYPSGESAQHVDIKVKERLAWGLGLGLELDETGKPVKAFHTGDMNQFRAQMALDLEKKSCIVYFANAHNDSDANGHVLGPLIITPKIPIDYAHTWFYSKFPFAFKIDQISKESHLGLRVQNEDKKADSDEVLLAFMPKGCMPVPVHNPHEKREAADGSLEVHRGSSYTVMRELMPAHSAATTNLHEIKKLSATDSSHTTVVEEGNEENSHAESDKPSSPFKMSPKPYGG